MFARVLIQECKPGTVEMLTRSAEETFVPQIRAVPGFSSYKVVKIDDRFLIVVSEFETREGVEQLEKLGAQWRIGKDAIVSVQPYFGELILDARSTAQEWQPGARGAGQPVETTGAGMQPH